jgi:hypothetical protein
MVRSVFSHKDLTKLSLEYVGVLSHRTTNHKSGEYTVAGKKKHMCGIYNLPDCKSHENMSGALSQKGLLKDVRGTPTHIVYNPHDMTELTPRAHYMNVSQIEDAIKAAQKKLGKPVKYKDFAKMRETLDTAKAELSDKDYRGALKALKAYKSKGMKSLDAEAKAIREKIMAAGKELIEKAKTALEAGDKDAAMKHLREVNKGFGGTDLAKEAKKLMEKAKEE